ncbi:MAG: hypothetical protein JRI68_15155 [Deltaproteobacteria bacterium]|nr:hypothetical protein [Deltaproteobacteria bacterium]
MALRFVLLLARLALLVAVFWVSSAQAQGTPVDQATAEQKAAAREAFGEGREAFKSGSHDDALRAFRASYEIVASPNAHLMIANSLRQLGQLAAAHDEFAKVAEEADGMAATDPKYAETADNAREQQARLAPQIGTLTVDVEGADDTATLNVAGQPVERARWGLPMTVEPGMVSVQLSSAGGDDEQNVAVTAGETTRITIAAAGSDDGPAEQPAGSGTGDLQRTMAYVAGGVGAAALITAAVFGGMALSTHDDIEETCGLAYCPERQDDIDSGKTYQTVSNVMLVLGLVGVSAGVVLYFTSPSEPDEQTAWVPALTIGPGSVSLEGRF